MTLPPGSVWYEKFPEALAYYEVTEPIRSPETLLPEQAQAAVTPLKPVFESPFDVVLMLSPVGMVKGADAVSAGDLNLQDTVAAEVLPISVSQPVEEGRQARERVVITAVSRPPCLREGWCRFRG